MTEFARKPSKLRQWWRVFWPALRSCLRDLWHGVLPGIPPDPCPHLADPDFWNDIVLQPAMPKPEPQAVPVPDAAPVEPTGLVVRIGRQGTGHVYVNGQELQRVKALHISVYPMAPVEVTLVMREPIDLQALTYRVEVSQEEPKEETTHA